MSKENTEAMQNVAKQIQKILEENEMALQPFLDSSRFGIVPRVQLVSTKEEVSNEVTTEKDNAKTPDKGKAGAAKKSKGTS